MDQVLYREIKEIEIQEIGFQCFLPSRDSKIGQATIQSVEECVYL